MTDIDKDGDKTPTNEDEFDNDLNDAFGDEEDEFNEGGADGDDKKDDETKDKKDDKKGDKSKSSAIHQKQKYREQVRTLKEKLQEYESKPKADNANLTEEQRKEQEAEKYLMGKIKDVLREVEAEKTQAELDQEAELQEELDDVLEANPDFTEQQILDVCEELGLTPLKAVKVLEREATLTKNKKPKPNVPSPKRGEPVVHDDAGEGKTKPKTLDSVNRAIKELIRKGSL